MLNPDASGNIGRSAGQLRRTSLSRSRALGTWASKCKYRKVLYPLEGARHPKTARSVIPGQDSATASSYAEPVPWWRTLRSRRSGWTDLTSRPPLRDWGSKGRRFNPASPTVGTARQWLVGR